MTEEIQSAMELGEPERMFALFNLGILAARKRHSEIYDKMHPNKAFGASSVGLCTRANVWRMRGKPELGVPIGSGKALRLDIGNYIESVVLDAFQDFLDSNDLGFLERQSEANSADGLHTAHTDALYFPKDGKPFPIEIKSVDVAAITNTERQHGGAFVAYPHHALQVAQFLYHARETLERGDDLHWYDSLGNRGTSLAKEIADFGVIKYISLRGWERESVVRLASLKDELERRLALEDKHWIEGTDPERLPDASAFPCGTKRDIYCPFWDYCFGEEEGPRLSLEVLESKDIAWSFDEKKNRYIINETEYSVPEVIEMGIKAQKEEDR
jgi:hypothetical protein